MTHIASLHFTQNGFTALMMACVWGDADMVKMLLKHGANIDHRIKVRL